MALRAFAVLALAATGHQARAGIKIGVEIADTLRGTEVRSVFPGQVAQKMGLRRGDVLLWVNNMRVTSATQFARILSRTNSIKVTWERGGRRHQGWASRLLRTDDGTEEFKIGEGKEVSGPDAPDDE